MEDEDSDELLKSESPRKGLFRLSHNDDGTISLFSLTLNKYVRLDTIPYLSRRAGLYNGGEIAKFELHKPEKPSNGAVMLLVETKFLGLSGSNRHLRLFDEERLADSFEFLTVKE